MKENDAKRLRANVKAIAEKKLREQKEIEAAAIQKQLQIELGKSQSIQEEISTIVLIRNSSGLRKISSVNRGCVASGLPGCPRTADK